MEDQLVEFETAKLAKEAGFDWETHKWYYHTYGLNGKEDSSTMGKDFLFPHSKRGKLYYSAPSQSLLQTWLRKKMGMIVWVGVNDDDPHYRDGDKVLYKKVATIINISSRESHIVSIGVVWESVLEEGLQYTLKEILEQ